MSAQHRMKNRLEKKKKKKKKLLKKVMAVSHHNILEKIKSLNEQDRENWKNMENDTCEYTRWPILIYNPKYLLKYFIYEKMVQTKVDQDWGGLLTVSSILTLRSIFVVKWR